MSAPRQLNLLATAWLLCALLSIASLLTQPDGQFKVGIGVLGFLIAPGLYLRWPAARIAVLILVWLGFALTTLCAVATLWTGWWFILVVSLFVFAWSWVQYHVLSTPAVRQLFAREPRSVGGNVS